MKRTRIDSLNAMGACFIFALILLCTVMLAFCIMTPISISEAMQKPNILNVQRQLSTKGPIDAKVNSWFEQKAMENVVMDYNKSLAKSGSDKKYQIYKLGKNHFWITNEQMQQDEISYTTTKYFECLNDINTGRSADQNEFCFRCTSKEQRLKMENLISDSNFAQDAADIDVNKEEKGEVTFVTLTVAPR